jgi:hypothetical protein
MADAPKAPPVWIHHPASGRTQQVSATAWADAGLASEGWQEATADQVAVVAPAAAVESVVSGPRSRRR